MDEQIISDYAGSSVNFLPNVVQQVVTAPGSLNLLAEMSGSYQRGVGILR